METPPTKCPDCKTGIIQERKGEKDGKSYHFWECSNSKDKGCRFTWNPPEEKRSNGEGFQKIENPVDTQHEEIMGEFKKMNRRLDGLAQFLGENK